MLLLFLWIDLKLFARGREPSFREGLVWSIGWLVVGLLAGVVVWAIEGEDKAVEYTTVYLVERSLSLDNLFVFLLLFAYFAVPVAQRARLLFWGIVFALMLRGLAILGGVALIEQFHFVIYILGATLLVLAYRIFRGVEENVDPAKNLFVRRVRRLFPVTDTYHGREWFVRVGGSLHATPLFLLPRRAGLRGHRLRDRLDPGRLRDHPGPVPDLDGQRLRACSDCGRCSCSSKG